MTQILAGGSTRQTEWPSPAANASQSGVVNYTGRLNGLQLGFINYADTAETGLQLGLLNVIPTNDWFSNLPNELAPAMIFVNWRF